MTVLSDNATFNPRDFMVAQDTPTASSKLKSRFQHTFEVAVAAIRPNPDQPRRIFDEAEINSLATTMEREGQLQPILLRRGEQDDEWILLAGERRWRAAQANSWVSILAIEHTGDPDIIPLLENLQRVDLSPVEEAIAVQRLIAEKAWTQDQTAQALGKSKSEISAVLGILSLPEKLLEAVLTSELVLSKNVMVELARVAPGPAQNRLFSLAHAGRLTIRDIRAARETDINTSRSVKAISDNRSNLPNISRIATKLRTIRLTGVQLSDTERDILVELRQEIDQILHRFEGGHASTS
jgi:ParB family chromosome partitioning protein